MTTPSKSTPTSSKTTTASDSKSDSKTQAMDAREAARAELHGVGYTGPSMAAVFGDDLFDTWANEVKNNPAYQLRDPDDPASEGATNSSGSNPPPALIVEYGDGPHQYVSTVFDAGQAIVQDGADPSGKAWKFPETAWRRFVARVRGDEIPDALQNSNDLSSVDGPTMHEAAAKLNVRNAEALAADRAATPDNRANEDRGK